MSLLEFDNVTLRFGGVVAVNQVSFNVEEGEVFALVGPNGAGKSTVFNLISRFYNPAEGDIRFDGKSILGRKAYDIATLGIARTFQNIELFEHATVLQNLLIGAHVHRTTNPLVEALFLPSVKRAEVKLREQVEEVIDLLDLAVHRDSMVAGLPYGARKVVELGRALCTRPKLLLLDEPSSGLNVEETEDMAFWIEDITKDLGITVIMVEHDMTLVSRVSDRVMAMNQGRVLAMGTPAEVQRHPAVVEAYIGAPMELPASEGERAAS